MKVAGVQGQRIDAGPFAFGIHRHLAHGEVPARELDGGFGAGAAAQREGAGHKRQFADGDAIHEILAPPIEGVPDLDGVFAVLGDGIVKDGIGMEAVVVVIRQFIAVGIVKRQNGLKPAGNRVGQIGDQFARAGRNHQLLTLMRLEPVPVGLAGGERLARPRLGTRQARLDPSVYRGRQRDAHVGGRLADLHLSRLIGVRLNHADGFLLREFRQLADAEDQRIRQPLRRCHL